MSNPQDHWSASLRPLSQQFNRQLGHPPVLPPPASLESGPQSFYTLPSLPSLGNGVGHPQPGHTFTIPSINTTGESHQIERAEHNHLPPPSSIATETALPQQQQQQQQQPQQQPQHLPVNSGPTNLPQGQPNRTSSASAYRPLNVKDALSYLDQVKIQFYNQADVYNNFLDIMKDFKSQSIDTPGVIERVLTLFSGHPNLIQGFNTFLPPGYRIECLLDPSDPHPIRVTTPTGTTTMPGGGLVAPGRFGLSWSGPGGATGELQQTLPPEQGFSQQQKQQPLAHPAQYGQQVQFLGPQQQQTAAPGAIPGSTTGQGDAGSQVEFNHAISYVNKIKTRFANQPDIYKQFLEILQTYQREQKPIGEVYEQVTLLFANSPDLLDDFKQFLPDTRVQTYPQETENGYYHAAGQNGAAGAQLPPVGNFPPPLASGSVDGSMAMPLQLQRQQQQQQQHMHMDEQTAHQNALQQQQLGAQVQGSFVVDKKVEPEAHSGEMTGSGAVASSVSDEYRKSLAKESGFATVTNPALVPGVPEPVPPSVSSRVSSLTEEIGFFDKVKKVLGNKQTYNEFLKVLNLFSQDIIDKDTLVERVDSFLGDNHPDLSSWFKNFVGWEETPQSIENITFKKHQLELSLCKAFGPSYRQLPKAETYMPCSGRDEMCWEVLNDEWVGHPTWASEESGFIAHRKNQYEEILFKIEEERHEFDYYMESNLRTIQTLETIANRIANMTPEQKVNFKLPPGLGHTSSTIYKKVIRKIYDKDRGFEVIDALHENPAIAVPIVLKRLKQKDEEWKRSQREWNKVWREMEQKVFFKSLDHLGLTFKQADKKLLTAKQLVSEISTVKVEQTNKRLHPLTPKAQEQLNYKFNDNEVLLDILKLADSFINKLLNYSLNDREKLTVFFKLFLQLFFGFTSESIEEGLSNRLKKDPSNGETGASNQPSSNNSNGSNDDSLESSGSKKRHRENDLLRDVLKKQSKSKRDDNHDSTATGSDSEETETIEEVERSGELWIKTTSKKFSLKNSPSLERRFKYHLFCNTTIYVFFRHLRTLYERLVEVKAMNDKVAQEIKSRKVPQFAKDLNLVPHQLEDMNIAFSGDKDCYLQLLNLLERLIEGEIEHQWFEESVRQGYRNKAYKMYTVDKVVQSMIKHMHLIVSDHKTSEIMVLYEKDRSKPTSTAKDQILYRMQVRSLMGGDENMFKITLDEHNNNVNIQFVGLDDLTINDQKNAEEKYNYYVTSYVMSHPTEGVLASKINMPFLKSFIEQVAEDDVDGYINSGLKVSICENSFRLFFESNTYDEFTSNSVYLKLSQKSEGREEKLDALKKLLDDDEFGWKVAVQDEEDAQLLEENANILLTEGGEAYLDKIKEEKEDANETTEQGDTDMKDASDKDDGKVSIEVAGEKSQDVEQVIEPSKEEDKGTSLESGLPEVKPEERGESEKESTVAKADETVTMEGDSTVVQNYNDTTIQQEGNDTTADETVNQDDTTAFEDANSTAV